MQLAKLECIEQVWRVGPSLERATGVVESDGNHRRRKRDRAIRQASCRVCGLTQVNLLVLAVAGGDQPLVVTIAGSVSNSAFVTVQPKNLIRLYGQVVSRIYLTCTSIVDCEVPN